VPSIGSSVPFVEEEEDEEDEELSLRTFTATTLTADKKAALPLPTLPSNPSPSTEVGFGSLFNPWVRRDILRARRRRSVSDNCDMSTRTSLATPPTTCTARKASDAAFTASDSGGPNVECGSGVLLWPGARAGIAPWALGALPMLVACPVPAAVPVPAGCGGGGSVPLKGGLPAVEEAEEADEAWYAASRPVMAAAAECAGIAPAGTSSSSESFPGSVRSMTGESFDEVVRAVLRAFEA